MSAIPKPIRRQMGRVGGLTTIARHGGDEVARRARAGLDRKFLDQVDPERTLPPQERARRLRDARRAYFAALVLKRDLARRRKDEAEVNQEQAEREIAEAEAELLEGGP